MTQFSSMDAQKPEVLSDQMTAVEHARSAGHARIVRWKATPGLAEELARAHTAMDAGRKVSQEQIEEFVLSRRAAKK
jgi:hypothetical protein